MADSTMNIIRKSIKNIFLFNYNNLHYTMLNIELYKKKYLLNIKDCFIIYETI